MDCSEFSLKQP